MKIHLRTMLALVFVINAGLANAQESKSKSYTLKEAVEFAKANNATAKNAKLDELLAKKKVNEILAVGLPQINAKGEFMHYFTIPTQALPDFISPVIYANLVGYNVIPPTTPAPQPNVIPAQFGIKNNLTVSASASQLIFDGSYLMGVKASTQYVNLTKLTTKQTDIEVELNVRKAYYQLLLLDVNLTNLGSTIEMLEKTSHDLNETAKVGLMEKTDADRLKLQLSTVKLNRDRLKDARMIAYQALKLQMGATAEDSIILADNLKSIPMGETAALDLASGDYSKRIEAKILEQQKKLNEIDRNRWQFAYLPTIAAFGQVQRNTFAQETSDLGKNWYKGALMGVTMTLPVFDGLMKSSKIQQTRINEKKIENGSRMLNQVIEIERQSARTKYLRSKEQLKIQEENVNLAKDILTKTELKLKAGMGSTLELTTAQNDYITAQSAYLNSLYEILVSEAELAKAYGN
ncbi:MAG: TolC family protein [Bacteroidia bacterium]|nr:TolC family protein [Bacteroidia bacterium]